MFTLKVEAYSSLVTFVNLEISAIKVPWRPFFTNNLSAPFIILPVKLSLNFFTFLPGVRFVNTDHVANEYKKQIVLSRKSHQYSLYLLTSYKCKECCGAVDLPKIQTSLYIGKLVVIASFLLYHNFSLDIFIKREYSST